MHHNDLEFEAINNPLISIPESASFHLPERDDDESETPDDADSKRAASNAAIEIFSFPENKTVCSCI